MVCKKITIVSDAACRIPNAHIKGRPNIGKSACGFIILDDEQKILHEGSKYLGELTVPQAEYQGLITAMDKACSICRWEVDVWLDSEFVIKQLNGEYRITSENMKPLFDEVKRLEQRFTGKVSYYHHPRTAKLAKQADKLANQELNSRLST